MMKAYLRQPNGELWVNPAAEEFAKALRDNNCLLWLDVENADDTDIELLLDTFGIHPLTVEDLIMPNVRPKLEQFDQYLLLVVQTLHLNGDGQLVSYELDMILGKNFLITCHTDPIPTLKADQERVEKRSPIMYRTSDFLLYALLDSIVESYFPILDRMDEKVDEVEEQLFTNPSKETLGEIYQSKKDTALIRRTLAPHREVMTLLIRSDCPLIQPAHLVYYRDIHDRLLRLNDTLEALRDTVTTALDTNAILVQNQINEVMKVLTALATVMLPGVIVASIYGMNFKHMPELQSPYGYPLALLGMAAMSLGLFWYFRRKRWL